MIIPRATIICRATLASLVGLMLVSTPTISSADATTERAELVRLLHEIKNLEADRNFELPFYADGRGV